MKLSMLSLMKMVQSLQLILVNLVKKQQPHNIGCCFFLVYMIFQKLNLKDIVELD